MEVAKDYITDRREHILLGEQQFGLLYVCCLALIDGCSEGYSLAELEKLYPQEFQHFQKCIQGEGCIK